jgi:hypothetical protein
VAAELAPTGVDAVLGHLGTWLSGSFAAGVSAGNLDEPLGAPGLYLVASVSDPAAAEDDLAAVQDAFPPKAVYEVDVAGRRLNQVVTEPGQTLSYGLVDDWLYLVSGDPEPVVGAADVGGLSANPRFVTVRDRFVSAGTNLFVDLEGARLALEEGQAAEEVARYERADRPLFTPLRALGGGTHTDPNGDAHTRLLLAIR